MKYKFAPRPRFIPLYWRQLKPVFETNIYSNIKYITLILDASAIPYYRQPSNRNYIIYVPPLLHKLAESEIRSFLKEKGSKETDSQPHAYPLAWLDLLFIGLFPLWELFAKNNFFDAWRNCDYACLIERGSLDHVSLLLYHEWHRLITALTLHADSAHLLSNLFFGSLFLYLAARILGFGLTVFAGAVSAAAGNFISVFLHACPVSSIGLSTFVFSIIGLSCASVFPFSRNKKKFFLSLAAALCFLALLGTQGVNIDYQAHLAGLGCGIFSGIFISIYKLSSLKLSLQFVLFFLTIAIFCIAWAFPFLS